MKTIIIFFIGLIPFSLVGQSHVIESCCEQYNHLAYTRRKIPYNSIADTTIKSFCDTINTYTYEDHFILLNLSIGKTNLKLVYSENVKPQMIGGSSILRLQVDGKRTYLLSTQQGCCGAICFRESRISLQQNTIIIDYQNIGDKPYVAGKMRDTMLYEKGRFIIPLDLSEWHYF